MFSRNYTSYTTTGLYEAVCCAQAHLHQKHGVWGSAQARRLMACVQPQPNGGQGVIFSTVLPGMACLGPVMKDLELSDEEKALLQPQAPQDSLLTAAAAKVDLSSVLWSWSRPFWLVPEP